MQINEDLELNLKDLRFIEDIKSIAIIGASKKRDFFFVRTFHKTFKGKVYAINPTIESIPDLPDVKVYSRISDIPKDEPIDFAFIEIPREKVKSVVLDCIEKGVKLVSIFTSGFADENTEAGRKLQQELIDISKGKINILGPNCMGLYYPAIGLRWRSSLPNRVGEVGIIAQSGGLCNLIIHALNFENIGVSKAFSIGNAADINIVDVINYFSEDDETKIIAAYIEGIPESYGQKLMKVLKRCKMKNKPVFIIKAGRTEVGAKAAISHTASLIGNFNIWKNAIHQSGAILISNLQELINTIKLFVMVNYQLNSNKQLINFELKNFCLASLSGGYGVICSDLLMEHNIFLPSFKNDKELYERLSSLMTVKGTSYNNPMDLAVMIYETEVLLKIFKLILSKDDIDGLIFEIASLYVVYSMKKDADLKNDLIKIIQALFQQQNENQKGKFKPIFIIMQELGYEDIEIFMKRKFQEMHVPVFKDISFLAESLEKYNEFYHKNENS